MLCLCGQTERTANKSAQSRDLGKRFHCGYWREPEAADGQRMVANDVSITKYSIGILMLCETCGTGMNVVSGGRKADGAEILLK
jgi:hypothetical protein